MKMKTSGWEEATGSIAERGDAVPAPIPAPTPIPTITPPSVPASRGIGLGFGFDISAHPGLWFLFGCLFVILVVFLIEYLGRKKERKD